MPTRDPISSNATLHALTERLATHSRSLPPFGFPGSDKLSAYRGPAPPPQLPILQLPGRHHEVAPHVKECLSGTVYPTKTKHSETRCGRWKDEDLDNFVYAMGLVMRREFDCWVEQCWTESFHHVFIHELPTLLIHLILMGASPTFLRKKIVHGGVELDRLFQIQMLQMLLTDLELRLSGDRHSEAGPSNLPPTSPLNNAPPTPPPLPRDGVCFRQLTDYHGVSKDDDDHALCLCQLTSCIDCFGLEAEFRNGPTCPLPYELIDDEIVAEGWSGRIETAAQSNERIQLGGKSNSAPLAIPDGKGYVRHPKSQTNGTNGTTNGKQPMPFPHPQMTDVLAVEEHLRWRLKELGANDPAVEARYGPSTNDTVALEGVNLPDTGDPSDDGSTPSSNGPTKNSKIVKVTRGKGKVRRAVNGTIPKKKDEKSEKGKATCYLPKEWTEESPQIRNTAIVLTFRHLVKLLHRIATTVSPFCYPGYSADIIDLMQMHPVALYRRLAEPSMQRRKSTEFTSWQDCMDKWTEELGAKEKAQGNRCVSAIQHREAIDYYTRAISLDAKKTVYFSNRAVALNALGEHEKAELDCKHILSKDAKNGKAFYQRALARRGMGRWREAESDLREVLRYQPGNDSAKKMLNLVKAEVAKLPKQTAKDAMDF